MFGQSANEMNQQVSITDPTATSYTFQNLPSGTWYFAVVSIDAQGNQSAPTNVISTTI
ncbi:MAG: fibronectin type III domain-containing protein [Steroidobacteraceae bacterium]